MDNKIQTQKGSNKRLFILTWTHSMHIFGGIPFIIMLQVICSISCFTACTNWGGWCDTRSVWLLCACCMGWNRACLNSLSVQRTVERRMENSTPQKKIWCNVASLLLPWLLDWTLRFTKLPASYALLLILPFFVFPPCWVRDLFLLQHHLSGTVSLAMLGRQTQ